MVNQFDRAQQLELEEYERNQAKAIMPKPTQPSATHCTDCGDPIPDARRKYVPGVQMCIDCQDWKEQKEKRHK